MTYLLHDKKIIYIRPHKTASTTIADHCAELPESESLTKNTGMGNQSWEEICKHISPKIWNTYTKVASIRNPWEQTASYYLQYYTNTSMYEMLLTREFHRSTISHFLFDKEKCIVDKVIRFENLVEDTKTILGIDISKHSNSSNAFDYRKVHTRATREYIKNVCAPEIKEFGYEY
jgi:hypothetical protein